MGAWLRVRIALRSGRGEARRAPGGVGSGRDEDLKMEASFRSGRKGLRVLGGACGRFRERKVRQRELERSSRERESAHFW